MIFVARYVTRSSLAINLQRRGIFGFDNVLRLSCSVTSSGIFPSCGDDQQHYDSSESFVLAFSRTSNPNSGTGCLSAAIFSAELLTVKWPFVIKLVD